MKKQDISVESLVGMIERGEIQLPEIQRRYVWKAPRVRDLLDSLYRGYPSGSVLVWETNTAVPTRSLQVHAAGARVDATKLLLDGQQRLTSLTAILRGEPIVVRGKKKPIDVLFNLDHPDGPPVELIEVMSDEEPAVAAQDEADAYSPDEDPEEAELQDLQAMLQKRTFVVASKQLAQLPNWVPVSEVFKSTTDRDILKKAGVTSFDDPRYDRYTKRLEKLRKIREYPYVMHILEKDLSYEEVAEIFVRVNSLGAKLRSSDLALAQITARWPSSLKLFEDFQEQCEKDSGFTLDVGLLVRTLVVFATGQCRFESVASISLEVLKSSWEEAKKGLHFAINFLKSNADIEDESLLSSPLVLVTLAFLSRKRSNVFTAEETRSLLFWVYIANARGRYSRGSSETILNADLATLHRGGGPQELIDAVKLAFGRLEILPEDLVGKGANSPLFSLAFLALRKRGAQDWHSGLGISLTHQGKLHFIQYHHIFPKALLRKHSVEKSEVNELANMAFISGNTNRRLGMKEPADYFPDIIAKRGPEALTCQAIPTAPDLHKVENYRQFLESRRLGLAHAMNAFLEAARHSNGAQQVA